MMTVRNTEWDHDHGSAYEDSETPGSQMLADLYFISPTQKLLSDNNSFVIDTDKGSEHIDAVFVSSFQLYQNQA